MSILSTRKSGPSSNGQRIVIAGVEKIGKTTLACDAPNVILVPLEQGFAAQTCERVDQLYYWEHVAQLCQELIVGAQEGSIPRGTTLVWDSATALGRMVDDYTIRTDPGYREGNPSKITLNTAHGGYGKGVQVGKGTFAQWLNYLDQLSMYGINSVITAHVFAADVVDPAYGNYQTWDIRLHSPKNQKETGIREHLTEWADMIGFLHEPVFVQKTERGKGDQKETVLAQGISRGQGRVLEVERTPAWIAGNRYNLQGSVAIPLEGGWNYLAQAIYESTKGNVDIFRR